MRTLYLLLPGIILLCSTPLLHAQTYSSTDFAVPGDEFLVSTSLTDITGLNINEAGSGITWDLSSLSVATQKKITYNSPQDGGYKTTFLSSCTAACVAAGGGLSPCTASCNSQWTNLTNLARNDVDSLAISTLEVTDISTFFNTLENGLAENMLGFSVKIGGVPIKIVTVYDTPDLIFPFPMQLNTTAASSSHYTIDLTSLGINIIYKSYTNRTHHAEGTGTVITPYGAFANSIKLKTYTTRVDSVWVNGSVVAIPYPADITYSWFDPAQRIPVLEITGQLYGDDVVYSGITFLDEIRCLQPAALFAYSPLLGFLDAADSLKVNFTNLSANADGFTWSFGDPGSGADNASSALNPSHWFTRAGTYSVQLTSCNSICDPLLCSTIALPLEVLDSTQTTAQFFFEPSQPCTGATVQFTNQSLNDNTAHWNFGDGHTSQEDSPVHTYTAPGLYTVELIAESESARDTAVAEIVVGAVPVAEITMNNPEPCPSDTVTLTAESNASYSYLWENITGDTSPISCNQCPSTQVIPAHSGTYKLTTYNDCGIAYDSIAVVVQDSLKADFTVMINGTEASFTETSGNALSWQWDFGDGTRSTEQHPVHAYAANGNFEVTLEASGNCNTDTARQSITVVITDVPAEKLLSPVSVAPNPFSDHIVIFGLPGQHADIRLMTMTGSEVKVLKNLPVQADGTLRIGLHDEDFSDGLLLLFLAVNGRVYVHKLMPEK
jgi:PKD repeat protein